MNTEKTDEPSLLAQLRALMPEGKSSSAIALSVAEDQARHLSKQLARPGQRIETAAITGLQRIHVEVVDDLPVSGCCFWDDEQTVWIIHISSREPSCSQRSTILHEYKHIIDHGRGDLLYGADTCASDRAEEAADQFAACVLVPEAILRSLWTSGMQQLPDLARAFDAPTQMVEHRLAQLSLCNQKHAHSHRAGPYRLASTGETPEPPSALSPTASKEPCPL